MYKTISSWPERDCTYVAIVVLSAQKSPVGRNTTDFKKYITSKVKLEFSKYFLLSFVCVLRLQKILTFCANTSPENINLTASSHYYLQRGYIFRDFGAGMRNLSLTWKIIKIFPLKVAKTRAHFRKLSDSVVNERKLRQYLIVCLNYRGGAFTKLRQLRA